MKSEHEWNIFVEKELEVLAPLLRRHGYTLDEFQPHTKGERYLMYNATTKAGTKLILLGKDAAGARVIMKTTAEAEGIAEIEHERLCRSKINELQFSYETFAAPKELLHTYKGTRLLSVQEYIEQPCSFLERSLMDQLAILLRTLKGQESAHATTYGHLRSVQNTFGIRSNDFYQTQAKRFADAISTHVPKHAELVKKAVSTLGEHTHVIALYENFLTHTDFVPHNFRVRDDVVYLLDYSSLTFGNKYDSWARLLNFMTLYNREVDELLTQYVAFNRTVEEQQSLHALRLYRLIELMWYYTRTLAKSEGNLLTLNAARVDFWGEVLASRLQGELVPMECVEEYKNLRDSLRSSDELMRQKGLH